MKFANVPSEINVFAVRQEGSKVDKKSFRTVRFARSKQQEDRLRKWIYNMIVSH